MRHGNLLKSTPFRLAIIFIGMIIIAFVSTGLTVYQLMKLELRQDMDQSIRETFMVIANSDGDSDEVDLLESVETNVRATRGVERIFLVTDNQGDYIGGNVPAVTIPMGWGGLSGDRIGQDTDTRYRVFVGPVQGKRLLVGRSLEELESVQDIISSSFAWATILVAFIASAGSAWLARRVGQRFEVVGQTMNAVAHGNLTERIPLIGRGDDIDILSGNINDALSRLENTVEGMRQVSSDIAHDLKTPLNRLRLIIDDALAKQRQHVPVEDDLLDAAAEADRINETFEALLRISQIETGSRKAKFAAVDLKSILTTLFEIYSAVATDAGNSLELTIEHDARQQVLGDRELLTQMFANLIENSIRHCPPDTAITVCLRSSQDGATASVEDNGPGIPEWEHEKAFQRLYRLEKSRTSPGSGLGLSLVKAVSDLHDGQISVLSMSPGLRIEIRFPPMQNS